LSQFNGGDRHRQQGNTVQDRIEPLLPREGVEWLNALPELSSRQTDQGGSTPDEQQADDQVADGENLADDFPMMCLAPVISLLMVARWVGVA
jgi:hypothetical protein